MKQNLRMVANGNKLSCGAFAGTPATDSEWIERMSESMLNNEEFFMDNEGVIHQGSIRQGDTITGGGNGTKISEGTFAAPSLSESCANHPDQWYAKNQRLFQAEVANMQRQHPQAKYNFMPQSGDMFWVIELKIGGSCETWQFMLRYMKDHPNNNNYGGSIRVLLLGKPSEDILKARALAAGRPGVPHLLKATNVDGKVYTYLCTRTTKDVKDGVKEITSAVQVAAWAGDWALHFEVGLHNKKLWNAWCDDEHFRGLKMP